MPSQTSTQNLRWRLGRQLTNLPAPPTVKGLSPAQLTIVVNTAKIRDPMVIEKPQTSQDLSPVWLSPAQIAIVVHTAKIFDLMGFDELQTSQDLTFIDADTFAAPLLCGDQPPSIRFDVSHLGIAVRTDFNARWVAIPQPYIPFEPMVPDAPHVSKVIVDLECHVSGDFPTRVPNIHIKTTQTIDLLTSPGIHKVDIGHFSCNIRRIPLAINLRRLVGGLFLPQDFEPIQKGIVTSDVRQARNVGSEEKTSKAQAAEKELDESTEAVSLWKLLYFILLPPLEELKSEFSWPSDIWPFQMEGVHFLLKNHHALLADEMGLGKTIQAIVAAQLLLRLKVVERVLIVCPASLKLNWYREFRKWAPELFVDIMQGAQQERRARWHKSFAHITIANYEQVRSDAASIVKSRLPFDVVILDEAQRIKNRESQTSRAVKKLRREYSWCLTGTPLENDVDELVSVLEFVRPGLISHAAPPPVPIIQKLMQPHFLRRKKTDVLQELPPKIYTDQILELEGEQRIAYQEAESKGVVYLRELGQKVTLQHVLALIQKLKQICNFDPETRESVKLDFLKEELESVFASDQKALVFSQFTVSKDGKDERTLEFLQKQLAPHRPLLYHGGMSAGQRDRVITEFKEDSARKLLLLSLRAGGLGLNLENASYVFHFDRWWNPAVEKQAEDRAHRFGQTQPVNVYRCIVKDTIEEKIDAKLRRKQALFDEVIEGSPQAETYGLTPEELFEVVGLDPALARVKSKRVESDGDKMVTGYLKPRGFEIAVSELYRAMGFNVQLTPESRDGGVDIYGSRIASGLVTKVAIQCKMYEETKTIGIAEVQRLWGILQADTELSEGIIVTTSRFSHAAESFAKGKRLTLIGKDKLTELLEEHRISLDSFAG